LRLSGVYGPGGGWKSTIGLMVKSAINDKKIIVCGKGDNLRDFAYVDDICRVIQSAVDWNKDEHRK